MSFRVFRPLLTPMMVLLFGQDMLDWALVHWRAWQARWARIKAACQVPDNQPIGSRTFTVLLTPQTEGGFAASVPALPEVETEGCTPDEVLAMTEEAIRALLAYRADMGIPVPDDPPPLVCRVTIEA
jgi:predicted RNase H-like HicB family nuclease